MVYVLDDGSVGGLGTREKRASDKSRDLTSHQITSNPSVDTGIVLWVVQRSKTPKVECLDTLVAFVDDDEGLVRRQLSTFILVTRQHYGQERTLRPLACIAYLVSDVYPTCRYGELGHFWELFIPFSALGLGEEECDDDDDDVGDETCRLACMPGLFCPSCLSHEGLSGVYRPWLDDSEVSTMVIGI